jgi:hypothetical protein
METFTLDPRRWWIARLIGTNPLLRRADRIEALVIVVAVVVSLAALAVAGAVGTGVYDARSRVSAGAQPRHMVSAMVIDTGTTIVQPGVTATAVRASWPATDGQATGSFGWDYPVKVGDRIDIWVDSDGNRSSPPSPVSEAAVDAVTVAVVLWFGVVLAVAATVAVTHWRLDRVRDADWESDIRCLQDGNRGTWRP